MASSALLGGCVMFLNFFYQLRAEGIRVSTTEWLSLLTAQARGFDRANLTTFYNLARALLVKRETQYDAFDRAFATAFHGVEGKVDVTDEMLKWLAEPIERRELSDDERALLQAMDLDSLRAEFRKRLAEQKERHDGGSHYIGTGGTSPFGQGGYNPQGIRVGASGAGNRSAVAHAAERKFQNLRSDRVLDTRQMGVALRRLRLLARDRGPEELDVEQSITASAKNAEIELVFAPPKKNRVKLLLLTDVGGSMDPFSELSEQLFSAAHQASHFAAFKSYSFHNCPYDKLYTNIERNEGVFTRDVVDMIDRTWSVVFIGDAWMSPHELTQSSHFFSFQQAQVSGIEWLRRFKAKAKATAWLNPEPRRVWNAPTVKAIRQVHPMFELTLDGLELAVDHLRGAKPAT
jgi:uncharacterized protein with von Willebrand factor type A (vWA) domain